jgi:putative ABC transport system permease protein
MRLIPIALRFVSLLVPTAVRPRWREEWQAEIDHAVGRGLSIRGRIAMAAGALPDALATRRIASEADRSPLPRAGIFHAVDQDLRYALRGLAQSPGSAFAVIVSLAVGIAASVAAFSVIDAVVFRPFPGVTDQHELVRLTLGSMARPRFSTTGTTHQDFVTMREGMTTIAALSAQRDATFAVFADGRALAVSGAVVSGNYFDVLGMTPAAGRFFLTHEDQAAWTHPVVVISDALWEQLYERAPGAIGRSLMVNGAPLEIVGVAPPRFIGLRQGAKRPSVWVPLAMGELALRDRDGRATRIENAGPLRLDLVGRRRAGVSLEQVSAEAATVRERLEATRADDRTRLTVSRIFVNDPAAMGPAIAASMAVPMLVLAIGCVNAANLVLARASRRVRDWTVRLAVGATRWRVVRQVLVEALVLATVAAALGLLLARWGLSFVASEIPVPIPLDSRVALFTVIVAVLTAVSFSLGPALGLTARASRRLSSTSSAQGAPTRSRSRFALVAVQAALSLGLLASGTQFITTVQATAMKDHIRDSERLVLAPINLDPLRLEREAGVDFYRRLLDRVTRLPGVAVAGLAVDTLVVGVTPNATVPRVWVPDSPPEGHEVVASQVSARFLDAVDIPLLQGRRFTSADEGALRTVVVNKAFMNGLLHRQAIGRTFTLAVGGAAGVEVTVVGVVDSPTNNGDLGSPIVYYPAPLIYQPAQTLYLRLDETEAFSAAALHAAVRDVDPRVPLADVATRAEIRLRKDSDLKFLMRAAAMLGLFALVLAAGGLYSVVSYVVSLRRQEVGIRLALGAEAGSIVGTIIRQALLPTLVGAAVGAACAAVASAVLRSRLEGVTPIDPLAFVGALSLMVGVMLLASWIPARHAGRVDPISVLRQE